MPFRNLIEEHCDVLLQLSYILELVDLNLGVLLGQHRFYEVRCVGVGYFFPPDVALFAVDLWRNG